MFTKARSHGFWMLLLGLYLAAWGLQDLVYLHPDNSFLLNAARLMLAGGSYSQDFFTPNPPAILFLYVPALFLEKFLHLNILVAFRLDVLATASASLFFCYPLLKELFKPDKTSAHFLFLILAALFLLFPLEAFGQREHFLLMLAFPYILLLACRLADGGKAPLSPGKIVAIGLMAGLGFSIKPYFLLTPLLLELYYLYRQRRLSACLRVETLGMLAIFLGYIALLWFWFQDYLFVILPFVLRNYHKALHTPTSVLYFSPRICYVYLALLFGVVLYKLPLSLPLKALRSVLWLSLLSFLGIFFLQGTDFRYHYLMPFTLSIFCYATLLCFLLRQERFGKSLFLALLFIEAVFSIFLRGYAGIKGIGFFWLLLIGLLSAIFILRERGNRQAYSIGLVLSLYSSLVFVYPLLLCFFYYSMDKDYKQKVLLPLVQFMQTQPPQQSIYSLAFTDAYVNPINDYSGSTLHQRMEWSWPLLAFLDKHQAADEAFFIGTVAEDLQKYKPDLLFVSRDGYAFSGGLKLNIDFPTYFSQDARFREEWKAYHLVGILRVGGVQGYAMDIYKRGSSG